MGAAGGVQVDFTPLGARRCLGLPMDELTNRVVALEDVLGPGAPLLVERLQEAPGWRGALRAARRRAAAARWRPGPSPRPRWRGRSGGSPRRTAGSRSARSRPRSAGAAATSRRAGGATSGSGPKAVARVLRFERALRLVREGRALADVAYDCGYADQPHLNRDFRALAGATPREVTFVQDAAAHAGLASARMSIHPTLLYRDAAAAIDFLERAFGFETLARHDNPDGTVAHSELRLGDDVVMVGSGADDLQDVPDDFRAARVGVYLSVEDLDAHYERARAAGADVDARAAGHRLRLTRVLGARPRGPALALRDLRPSGGGREPGLGVDRAGVAQALEHRRDAPPAVSPGGDGGDAAVGRAALDRPHRDVVAHAREAEAGDQRDAHPAGHEALDREVVVGG